MKQLSLILIGGGDRGSSYLKYLLKHPDSFKVVGLAEPVTEKREYLKNLYNIPGDMCFDSYEKIFSYPKFADIAMICTQDKLHFAPAMKAIEKNYDILLEKPIAPTPNECLEIADAAKKKGVKVLVCHVLRYTPFYKCIKEFIGSGKLGEIINITHTEGVGITNMSHSYVRGNWRKTDESAPMILAKCCHDTDLIQWLIGEVCTKVQSFGTRTYFREENAPDGAPLRCLDGCPHKDNCVYYAPSFYKVKTAEIEHFRAIVANKFNPSDEDIDRVLITSPYGRCVYHCDNDVVDHQIVNMEFASGKNAVLVMSPFNKAGRISTIMGTKGELRADMEEQSLTFYDFLTRKTVSIYEPAADFDQSIAGGHGGGDMGIMEDLYEYMANGNSSDSISDISFSCTSHMIAFAAEKSRLSNTIVNIDEFSKRFLENHKERL